MPEENNRREHPDARRDEGKSCGVIQDLKNIFDSFRGIFHKELPMSIAQIEKRYSFLIDEHILEKERAEKVKFAGGTFKIKLGSSKYTLGMELYYKTPEGKWLKETNSDYRPLESLTDESRALLEQQKELTYPIRRPESTAKTGEDGKPDAVNKDSVS